MFSKLRYKFINYKSLLYYNIYFIFSSKSYTLIKSSQIFLKIVSRLLILWYNTIIHTSTMIHISIKIFGFFYDYYILYYKFQFFASLPCTCIIVRYQKLIVFLNTMNRIRYNYKSRWDSGGRNLSFVLLVLGQNNGD